MAYEGRFLCSLALTIALETAMLVLLCRLVFKTSRPQVPLGRLIFAGILCSFATLPYLWFILPAWIESHAAYIAVGELSVTFAEAVIYGFVLPITWPRAACLSVACNLTSFLIGLVVF